MHSYPQTSKQANWLLLDLPVFLTDFITDSLLMQRKLLNSAIELTYAPLLSPQAQSQPIKSDPFTEKLVDPALSFTKAVETAEPLFNILNDEEV